MAHSREGAGSFESAEAHEADRGRFPVKSVPEPVSLRIRFRCID